MSQRFAHTDKAVKTTAQVLTGCLLLGTASPAQAEKCYDLASVDLRSMPAVGFFPLGGNALINKQELSTYAIGVGLDTFNVGNPRGRASILNFSGYLLGVNWTGLAGQSDTQAIDLSYFRFGPHYRFAEFLGWRGASLGAQAGYAVLLRSESEEATSKWQHGIDLSFTLSLGQYEPPTTYLEEQIYRGFMTWGGVVTLAGTGLVVGGANLLSVQDRTEEQKLGGGLMFGLGIPLVLCGIVLGGLADAEGQEVRWQ